MKGSIKLFIASLLVFACSIGFFLGSMTCNKHASVPVEIAPPQKPDFKPGNEKHKDRHAATMDSILQLSDDQKILMKEHRQFMDSTFKVLFKQKMDAEKELKGALESGDSAKVASVKEKILASDGALLDNRIQGFFALSKILSKDQMEKFKDFPKGHFHKKGPFKKGHPED